jgi:hypothetical protein
VTETAIIIPAILTEEDVKPSVESMPGIFASDGGGDLVN